MVTSGTLMQKEMEDVNKTLKLVQTTNTGTFNLMSASAPIQMVYVNKDFSGTLTFAHAFAKLKTADQENTGISI